MGNDELAMAVAEALRRGSKAPIQALGSAAKGLRNRRNATLFWRSGIERAAEDLSRAMPDPLGAILALAATGALPLDDPLDNGETPLAAMAARSPVLAARALEALGLDPNPLDKAGQSAMARALSLARSDPSGQAQWILSLAGSPRFDLSVGDQGAQACFKGLGAVALPWAVAEPEKARRFALELGEKLSARGYDFNAARETPDAKWGSTVNTPLAYCVKKAAQWSRVAPSKTDAIAQAVECLAELLMGWGADPSLQMEPGQRVALIEACREGRLNPRLAASLEAGVLAQALGSGVQGGQGAPSRRARL